MSEKKNEKCHKANNCLTHFSSGSKTTFSVRATTVQSRSAKLRDVSIAWGGGVNGGGETTFGKADILEIDCTINTILVSEQYFPN